LTLHVAGNGINRLHHRDIALPDKIQPRTDRQVTAFVLFEPGAAAVHMTRRKYDRPVGIRGHAGVAGKTDTERPLWCVLVLRAGSTLNTRFSR